MKLVLFFTWDVSLQLWQERGLLAREIKFYEYLARRGVDVTFLTWGDAKDSEIGRDLKGISVIPLYTRLPRPHNKALRFLVSFAAPFAVRTAIRRADILKTNQMWGAWCAVLAQAVYRKKLILRSGFELYDFTHRQGHGILRRAFIKFLSKVAYSCADLVCVAAYEDRNFIICTFKTDPEKILIRPNWIDTEKFSPVDMPEQSGRILYVGRLSEQKNLSALIEALEGSAYILDIVGDGELRNALEAQARSKNFQVNFLGNRANDDLPSLYSAYPLFVLPSHYEGNPKTLLEAMSCGRAVLGSNVPGIGSVIRHDESGYLCRPEAADLRRAIDILMKDGDLRRRLGREARRQIEQTQTLDRLIEQELASYQSLQSPEERA